jgi:proline iminopeptidase
MTVSVKGAEIFYSSTGTGPVCFVLTGIGARAYELQMPAELTERLTLVFVELRGSGRSTGDATQLTFDVLAEDLEAVRAQLGVERVAVLGHSIVGMLAIEYGRRCPRSVSHVIAVGTPPLGDMGRLSARTGAFFEQDASEDRKRVLRQNMSALPPGAPPTQMLLAQAPMRFFNERFDAAPLLAEAVSRPRFILHLMGTLALGWDVTVGADSLRVPILVALGRHDYVVPHVLWDGVAASLPDATLRIFDRSGHQPFFEEPAAFADAVTGWMGSRGGGAQVVARAARGP